jgi:biopolymer transport protein ExbD
MDLPIRSVEEDSLVATINTTPLVDVMLVLLIIFLITIPVVLHSVGVDLPKETNRPLQASPANVNIAVTRDGIVFWNEQPVADASALSALLKTRSMLSPQPEVHIRADRNARYESIGKVVFACQRAGIAKVAFVTEPLPDEH